MEKQIKISADLKALRRGRELRGVSRQELGERLGISGKAIEKIENGRTALTDERFIEILDILELKRSDFIRIKKGRGLLGPKREIKVTKKELRRSYKKIITKECLVLKSMRKEKKYSQDHASFICGYARPAIGHIENGRIEIPQKRILHIVESYGYKYEDFETRLGKEELRDQIIEFCINKLEELSDEKLDLVKGIIQSF